MTYTEAMTLLERATAIDKNWWRKRFIWTWQAVKAFVEKPERQEEE